MDALEYVSNSHYVSLVMQADTHREYWEHLGREMLFTDLSGLWANAKNNQNIFLYKIVDHVSSTRIVSPGCQVCSFGQVTPLPSVHTWTNPTHNAKSHICSSWNPWPLVRRFISSCCFTWLGFRSTFDQFRFQFDPIVTLFMWNSFW